MFWSGWEVLKEDLPWLVDEMAICKRAGYANAPETIYAIAIEVPSVINSHEIASGKVVGRQVFVEMHLIVEVPDVETAHRITEEVELACKRYFHQSEF